MIKGHRKVNIKLVHTNDEENILIMIGEDASIP